MNLKLIGLTLCLGLSACAGRFTDYPGDQLINYSNKTPTRQAADNQQVLDYQTLACAGVMLGGGIFAEYAARNELEDNGGPFFSVVAGGLGLSLLSYGLGHPDQDNKLRSDLGMCIAGTAGIAAGLILEANNLERNSNIPNYR